MPETTPLIKAALNLRGGAGFDVYRRRGDSMLTNTMKEDLTQGLVDLFSDSILAIILYGSVARNDNTDESDIDIVIIIKNELDDATKDQLFIGQRN